MARRKLEATREVELARTDRLANPEPPDVDKAAAARAEELERGTGWDWYSDTTENHWSELFEDRSLLTTLPERTWVADVKRMIARGGRPAAVEKALTLPLRQANLTIETPEKDRGQAEFVRDVLYSSGQSAGMTPDLVGIVAQMTDAIAVKRTYHELVFERRPDGRFGYKKVAWRPPSSCEMIRDRKTGDLRGFRQYVDPETVSEIRRRSDPRDVAPVYTNQYDEGYVVIPKNRALVYVHGQHRDPINGVSDLDTTHWAWTMQQKIMLLWATFLDGQANAKVVAYGDSKTEAENNARAIASLRGSGVLGMQRNVSNPDQKLWELLDTSGKGADQFAAMITYLDQQMTMSVLAGFLDLTSNATQGIGSYALSADQSGLFLTSRQAVAKEIAAEVTQQLIAPLVRINFGHDAPVPRLVFEKMSQDQTDKAIQLLQQLGSANSIHVPEGFLDLLIERVAQSLDLPDEKVEQIIEEKRKLIEEQRQQDEEARRAALAAGQVPEQPGTAAPPGQKESPFNQRLTDTVQAVQETVRQHRAEKQ